MTKKKKSPKNKKMFLLYIFLGTALLLFLVWIGIGYFGSNVENLSYTVIDSSKEYEIREIHEHIIAETQVQGSFETGTNEGFSILADYIFGNNKKQEVIGMTAPVIEEESEVIAMTAPVMSKDTPNNEIVFSFVMPKKYTIETLPQPVDPRIEIKLIPKKRVAALRFRGLFTDANFDAKIEELKSYLERDGIEYFTISSAGYNPPWTPPFMRRNEVWAEIEE